MMLSKKLLSLAVAELLALTAVFIASKTVQAAQKDTLVVTAQTTSNGVTPTSPGSSSQWFYAYCVVTGNTLTDTIPLAIQVENTNGTSGDAYTITLGKNGTPLSSDLTLPGSFTATDDGSTTTVSIGLSGTFNTSGNFPALVQVDTSPPGQLTNAPVNIHILVSVGSACATPPATSCFLTDSEFDLLNDCSGNPVALNTGGTFQIVAINSKKIVSTNPGEFYYNLIWNNTTGSDKTVVATFAKTNLNTMGANSVHAFVFNSSGFTEDLSSFDLVNQDGTPCGPAGPCTILVPNGEILWLTWHLQYSFIGQSTAGLSRTCSVSCSPSAKNHIDATATLTSDSTTLTTCTASACGYLKH